MTAKHADALMSSEISANGSPPFAKKTSEKKIAHARSIASKGSAAASIVRTKMARKRQLSEAKILKAAKNILLKNAEDLARAWLIPAYGSHFVFKKVRERDEKGRIIKTEHVLVEGSAEIAEALDCIANERGKSEDEDTYYYVTVKDPDFRAIVAAYDRMFGKSPESLKVSGTVDHKFSLIGLARERQKLPAHVPLPVEARVIESSEALALERGAHEPQHVDAHEPKEPS